MPTTSEQIAEAMKKLDAKLVAYLAGEEQHALGSAAGKHLAEDVVIVDDVVAVAAAVDDLSDDDNLIPNRLDNEPINVFQQLNTKLQQQQEHNAAVAADYQQKQLQLFTAIESVGIQMEALTLEPEGTRRMELLQNDLRPIFTVECQLSQELIKLVPRSDMFHMMQFESEKFHSLTQCTRFGQAAERKVKLSEEEVFNCDSNNDAYNEFKQRLEQQQAKPQYEGNPKQKLPNLGRIHFLVWWREPGTCLNEMLGNGLLQLNEFYNANLLEQCKKIKIERRNTHLANLYLKVNLQLPLDKRAQLTAGQNVNLPMSVATQQYQQHAVKTQQTASAVLKNLRSANNNTININNNNNNNYMADTSTVRLLKGLICVDQLELQQRIEPTADTSNIYLICRNFWKNVVSIDVTGVERKQFGMREEFSVLNDSVFRQRMDKQFLNLELWLGKAIDDDPNGNAKMNTEQPIVIDDYIIGNLGVVQLPLHQFFIAYRDVEMTNHLCKAPLPVISLEGWAPVLHCDNGSKVGQLKCLLAIGTEEQIKLLKDKRHLAELGNATILPTYTCNKQPLTPYSSTNTVPDAVKQKVAATVPSPKPYRIDDLLLSLTQELSASSDFDSSTSNASNATLPLQQQTPTAAHILKPHLASNLKTFKFFLDIQRATGLPLNPSVKTKKQNSKRNAMASKRFPPDEPPTTYVTFQAQESYSKMYKSHEGPVYATKVIEKSLTPRWQGRFRVAVTTDYLTNQQKRFILKIWKKAATDAPGMLYEPTPLEDAIIGFAALDLTVFLQGMQISGWLKIVDFNGRVNGQLEVRALPLDDVIQLMQQQQQVPQSLTMESVGGLAAAGTAVTASTSAVGVGSSGGCSPVSGNAEQQLKHFEQSLDITHLNLGDAISRKTKELQQIADNLRERLGEVTGGAKPQDSIDLKALDHWQTFDEMLAQSPDDDDMAQFELDLNTQPPAPSAAAAATGQSELADTNTGCNHSKEVE